MPCVAIFTDTALSRRGGLRREACRDRNDWNSRRLVLWVGRRSSFSSHSGAAAVRQGGELLPRENSPGLRRRARQLDRSVNSAGLVGPNEV